ncbi:MAG: TRAM domain-containing protein [Candidatus Saccharimonadales bacterium]
MKDYIQIVLLVAVIALLVTRKNSKPEKLTTKKTADTIILDTCALIDGRILELTNNGFMTGRLVIPHFILSELQHLADGSDAHKRERARFGLEVVQQLQANPKLDVAVDNTKFDDIDQVDDKLVALAQRLQGRLYTTDYNLNKVADIKGVTVLNVNEMAQQLRPVALPGEKKTVKIVQKGSNKNQGVGYLDDGTMVVVDGAARLIGKHAEVEVTRIHQTVAGKMIFAEVKAAKNR